LWSWRGSLSALLQDSDYYLMTWLRPLGNA